MKVKTYTLKDLDTNFIYDFTDPKKLEEAKKMYPNHTVIESTVNIQYYIEITLINKKGQMFQKGFDDKQKAIVFLNKARRGNKLLIADIFCPSASVMEELDYYSKELK